MLVSKYNINSTKKNPQIFEILAALSFTCQVKCSVLWLVMDTYVNFCTLLWRNHESSPAQILGSIFCNAYFTSPHATHISIYIHTHMCIYLARVKWVKYLKLSEIPCFCLLKAAADGFASSCCKALHCSWVKVF